MNAFIPTGRVINPVSTTFPIILPNRIGSKPRAVISKKKIGTVSRIIAREFMHKLLKGG